MDSEAKIIISFLFKRSGKNELKETEIYLPLSIELGWFSNRESIEFVKHALKQKLLIKKGDLVEPSFDIQKIDIPVGFYPSKTSFEAEDDSKTGEEQENVLDMIIHTIVEKTKQDEKEIIEKIREIREEKSILPEVAALLIAKDCDIDVKRSYHKIFIPNL